MIKLSKEKKHELVEAMEQTDAILTLEGFEKTEEAMVMDNAVLDGRFTDRQLADLLLAYAKKHKTVKGFIQNIGIDKL